MSYVLAFVIVCFIFVIIVMNDVHLKEVRELKRRISNLSEGQPLPATPQIMIGDKETGFKIG